MQFVKNGPDIPERLLHAQEDGNVVFFCGAGISRPAGLPAYCGLVKQLAAAMGLRSDPMVKSAITACEYDTAVGRLEAEVQGDRQAVRKELARILTPDPDIENATQTHEALLTLSTNRQGHTRLITTNFDRLFEEVMSRESRQVERFRAPLLPVPKKRWDGLVYLHGLLPESPSGSDLQSLVVSSGDFGLAYLTERWAARFVSELLRNFVVCFVGYGINDPVMRYMMDALAADRQLGESPREHFAFGTEDTEIELSAKNVTPILYRRSGDHGHLHETLHIWSETYRDGVSGKEQIVVKSAMARPVPGTKDDDFIGRTMWALSDSSGLPAKRFADLDPVPSLQWLEPLSEKRLGQADLVAFGISPASEEDKSLVFSLTNRPTPYGLAPWMALVGSGAEMSRWDGVMEQIARWLTRHLGDPALVLWCAKHGGALHQTFALLVRGKLEELRGLEEKGDEAELERIRTNAPNAIPGRRMRTLWQLLVTGQARGPMDGVEFYRWRKEFQRSGLTLPLRFDLREKLRPRVALKEPFTWPTEEEETDEADVPKHMSRLVEAEVVLSTREVRHQVEKLRDVHRWVAALPELLDDFSGLLRDALDLMRVLEQAGDDSDPSYMHQPSISEHSQNDGFRDWTTLIELVRDAWCATCGESPGEARRAAEAWWRIPYPAFRRLALFAATHEKIVPRANALDWLLADRGAWLWSPHTMRETCRLLVSLAPRLRKAELIQVEAAILAGPPRKMYRSDAGPEMLARVRDHDVWLRLAKLADSGAQLSPAAAERLEVISAQNPAWRVASDERDEFSAWIGPLGDGRESVAIPRDEDTLVEWLKVNDDEHAWQQDDWAEQCRQNFDVTSAALSELAKRDIWPRRRWDQALRVWTERGMREASWAVLAPVFAHSTDGALRSLSWGVSHWLRALATGFEGQEDTFLRLCDRLLDLASEEASENDEEVDDPVFRAINHPVGHTTGALLEWWWRRPLKDDIGLDEDLRSRFSRICDVRVGKFRHGRVLLAEHVMALFRVDRDWTARFLLPLFDWKRSAREARAAWVGFLLSPRLYPPLVESIKSQFLDTANHYDELGRCRAQYAWMLVVAGLDRQEPVTQSELARATKSLSQKGLENVAATLVQALEAAGGQRAECWKNRVLPYVRNVWPKTQETASASIAENFALLAVAAGGEFPAALEEIQPWLQKVEYPDRVIEKLHRAKLHERFSEEVLMLLDRIIGDSPWGMSATKMTDLLSAMREKMEDVETDGRFQRLEALVKLRS